MMFPSADLRSNSIGQTSSFIIIKRGRMLLHSINLLHYFLLSRNYCLLFIMNTLLTHIKRRMPAPVDPLLEKCGHLIPRDIGHRSEEGLGGKCQVHPTARLLSLRRHLLSHRD